MHFKLSKLQASKIQLQTLQSQKGSVNTFYSNVSARIDTVRFLWIKIRFKHFITSIHLFQTKRVYQDESLTQVGT